MRVITAHRRTWPFWFIALAFVVVFIGVCAETQDVTTLTALALA